MAYDVSVPIRDLQLAIAGTRLEPLLARFEAELVLAGLTRLRPRFYLSSEWGVVTGTIAIAIPFYLAGHELTRLHAERTGHVEGYSETDILRYLRHEMGHVVQYAYRLDEDPTWIASFGQPDQAYAEEYRPEPFSRRYVRHLPGWYAQKHPEEDWAETFAVWMTPGRDWRTDYRDWPDALAKLECCEALLARFGGQEPLVGEDGQDEEVGEIGYSLDDYYRGQLCEVDVPPGLDSALASLFDDFEAAELPASALLLRIEAPLVASVYRWTGHFPERIRGLVRHLAGRADELDLRYPADEAEPLTVAITALLTALAMNHVHRGGYSV